MEVSGHLHAQAALLQEITSVAVEKERLDRPQSWS